MSSIVPTPSGQTPGGARSSTAVTSADEMSDKFSAETGTFGRGVGGINLDRSMELREYAQQMIGEPKLWDALVDAIASEITAAPVAYWVVLVDNSIMALAGAAAIGKCLGRTVTVPMRASERLPNPDTLARELRQLDPNESLNEWLRAAHTLPEVAQRNSCPLIRAWGMRPDHLVPDLGRVTRADDRAPDAPPIALLRSTDPEDAARFSPDTVVNLTIRKDAVVARTILALGQPGNQPVASPDEAARLIHRLLITRERSVDELLHALNTPDHDQFEWLCRNVDFEPSPNTTKLFNSMVLNEEENRPRHAAALFLVAHFNRIPANQLIAMGDLLVRETPATLPAAEAARLPSEITDRVIEDCGIRFSLTRNAGAYAIFAPKDDSSTQVAGAIRHLFSNEAALLKERYLTTLAQAITLGHPSGNIARLYEQLEFSAIRHAAALDSDAARERLVRVALGHPALTGERDFDRHEIENVRKRMERVILRLPGFVSQLSEMITALPPDDILSALCTAVPAAPDEERDALFSSWAAEIFWECYASGITGLTLRGYPALFQSNAKGDVRRRDTLLRMLKNALCRSPSGLASQALMAQVGGPFLGRLLIDIGLQFPAISMADDVDLVLLTETAATYLSYALSGRTWREVNLRADAADCSLALAFLVPRTRQWIDMPAERLANVERDIPFDELQRTYQLCRTALEGLVGTSSFESNEEVVIEIWMIDVLGAERSTDNIASGRFSNSQVWADVLKNPQEAMNARFYGAIRSLLELVPLMVVMAATRTGHDANGAPVFSFSEPLKERLVQPIPKTRNAMVKELMRLVRHAHRFRMAWRDAIEQWHITGSSQTLVMKTFKDREMALNAFNEALKPYLEKSRQPEIYVRMQGGQQPAASSSNNGSSGPDT
jgi:hypothetical protein